MNAIQFLRMYEHFMLTPITERSEGETQDAVRDFGYEQYMKYTDESIRWTGTSARKNQPAYPGMPFGFVLNNNTIVFHLVIGEIDDAARRPWWDEPTDGRSVVLLTPDPVFVTTFEEVQRATGKRADWKIRGTHRYLTNR